MKSKYAFLYFSSIIVTIMTCLLCQQAVAAKIITSVDRNPVNIEESFKIFFTATDSPDGDPDFSPLGQDFDIVNQSQSSSSSWDNGTYSNSIRWTLEVTAKKAGDFVIPAISFGSDASEPLSIVVKQGTPDQDATHNNEDIYLEVKASPEQPYVQSQVLYTIRLYRRVDVAQAELSEPELADAIIEKLGEDSNFNTVVNGVSYLVTERKYAVFPQKSGPMTIKPLTLTAQVIVASQPDFRDFFGSRMTKTKRILSNEVMLNVKPAPPEFKGKEWLAAEKLELTQEWSGDTQKMKAGEPLTRTLILRGVGTTVGQLPELSTVNIDAAIKAYPDKPVLNEQKTTEGVTATRQEKIAFIPATAGKYTLAAIEIPWFNIKTHKMEVASIPETEINVIGVSQSQADAKSTTKPLTAPTASITNPETSFPPQVKTSTNQDNIWLWTSLFLALGWLATVVFFVLKQPKKQATEDRDNVLFHQETNLKECVKKLKQACSDNDAQATKDALLAWGKIKFGVSNLGMIAESCDARLRDEIVHLNQILYGKEKSEWSGKKLMQAFTENKAREKISGNDNASELEPLHRL